MKSFFWIVARTLQMVGMVQTGWALLHGLSTSDATAELKMLLVGVAIFVTGVLIQRAAVGNDRGAG